MFYTNVIGIVRLGIVPKGHGSSRPVTDELAEEASSSVTGVDHLVAAENLARRLNAFLAVNRDSLSRAFDEYIEGARRTIWDINYDVFQRVMNDIIASQQGRLNQVMLIFGGALRISEALREVGNDTQRQNQYARYVGKFITEQGFMPWVEQQGGWVS